MPHRAGIERGAKADTTFLLYDEEAIRAQPLHENAQEKAFIAQVGAFVQGAKAGISPLPASESVSMMRVIDRVQQILEAQEK